MTLYERLDRAALASEARIGRHGFAVLTTLAWMVVASLCVRPGASRAVYMGAHYAKLSLDPLGFQSSPVGYRILTPLLSWAVGLTGESIRWTNLGLAALLLFAVQTRFRGSAPRSADAPLAAGTLALSLVTLSTVFSPAYCDPATYLIVFGMWWVRSRRPWVHGLFLLGLLNRESIAFLLPWFVWLHVYEAGAGRRARALGVDALGFGTALGLYALFRAWVAAQAEVGLTLDYYLVPLARDPLHFFRMTLGRQWLGLYSVFGVLWLVPVLSAVALLRRGERAQPFSMLLLVLCTWAQLVVAYDTSRMFTLGFMVMVLALDDAFSRGDAIVRRLLPWLLLAQTVLPQIKTAQHRAWVMGSPLRDWLWQMLGGGP